MLKLWITSLRKGCGIPYNDNNDMEQIRITKVIRTGTSLCVVIPKEILHALKIERGDQVCFGILDDNSLVIRKITNEDFQKLNSASAGATAS